MATGTTLTVCLITLINNYDYYLVIYLYSTCYSVECVPRPRHFRRRLQNSCVFFGIRLSASTIRRAPFSCASYFGWMKVSRLRSASGANHVADWRGFGVGVTRRNRRSFARSAPVEAGIAIVLALVKTNAGWVHRPSHGSHTQDRHTHAANGGAGWLAPEPSHGRDWQQAPTIRAE